MKIMDNRCAPGSAECSGTLPREEAVNVVSNPALVPTFHALGADPTARTSLLDLGEME